MHFFLQQEWMDGEVVSLKHIGCMCNLPIYLKKKVGFVKQLELF